MVNLCGLVNIVVLEDGKLGRPSGFDEYDVVKGCPVGYPVCVIAIEETRPVGGYLGPAEACLKRVIPPKLMLMLLVLLILLLGEFRFNFIELRNDRLLYL